MYQAHLLCCWMQKTPLLHVSHFSNEGFVLSQNCITVISTSLFEIHLLFKQLSLLSIAWSGSAVIYFGSKHTMFLTTGHYKGHLSNNLTVNDCRNTWHSFWYSNICLSLTFFFFYKSVMGFLAANPISTSFTWSRFSFSMTSTFASFAIDVTFSITLFLMNLSKMVHKMSYRYSAMKGNIGLSLCNTSRNGCSIFAIVQKNCRFAGTRSLVTPCRDVKLWLFGIFDLGHAQIWAINTCISHHIRMALSATATSSSHLVTQNCNGNFLEVDTFI